MANGLIFFYGLCMGVAEAIPGVNGATIALLFRIYERIIVGIQEVLKFKFHDLPFFIFLLLGNLVSIRIFSAFMPDLMRAYPLESNALIFGLMLVAVLIPYRQVDVWTPGAGLMVLVMTVFAFWVTGLDFFGGSHSGVTLFVVGAIGACGLLLPGLSGSYLLKVLGQYEYVLDHVHMAFELHPMGLRVVIIFILGMAFGGIFFSKLLSYCLSNFHALVMAAMTGLTLGGLRPLWPGLGSWHLLVLMLIGAGAMGAMIYKTKELLAKQDK